MGQDRLLDIAVREFGRNGLEGASTRGIASAAGTAMSSITYHYGGKEGLYLAAADHIASQMCASMAPVIAAESVIADDDAAGARAAIHRILGKFIEKMASEANAEFSMFVMREQLDPTEGFDRIYTGLLGQMLERLATLVCVATGVRDEHRARVTAITLMGQPMTLRAMRGSILRLLGAKALDAAIVREFQERIDANIDAILDAMIRKQGQS